MEEVMASEKDKDYDFLAQLISLVKENKMLYEKKDPFYYNRLKREKVWALIATETNRTASECKNKWTALREKFIRELKKKDKLSDWDLFNEMLFLKDVTIPRRTHSNELLLDITPSLSSSPKNELDPFPFVEEYTTSAPLKKRKTSLDQLSDQCGSIFYKSEEQFGAGQRANIDNDADELFIRTVVSMITNLPSQVKDDIKDDIFCKIIEARKRYRDEC